MVVRRARTLGGYHQRAERMLGSAAGAERGALGRLPFAAQHQAADAFARLFLARNHPAEPRLRVEVPIRRAPYDLGDAIKRLGKDVIEERYGNLIQMYERITGEDCFLLRLHVRAIDDLESVLDNFTPFGQTTTSIIQSSPVPQRAPALPENGS